MKRLAALAFALLCPVLGLAQYNSYTAFPVGAAPSYEGLWWNPSESGWGISIAHQGDIMFVTYYTYDASGKAVWYAVPNANQLYAPGYTGVVYRGRGPAFDSPAWDASKVTLTPVGSATFGADVYQGSIPFKYMIEGDGTIRAITRLSFATPASVCD